MSSDNHQSDIEWLAVTEPVYRNFNGCTFDEWQNMRYKLGLDKKPHISGDEWANKLKDRNDYDS